MTTIELPPDLEDRLKDMASRQGTDIGDFVRSALEEKIRRTEPEENRKAILPERPTADEIARALADGKITPPEAALVALREIARRQERRSETSGEDSQRLLREARAGGLYGLDPTNE